MGKGQEKLFELCHQYICIAAAAMRIGALSNLDDDSFVWLTVNIIGSPVLSPRLHCYSCMKNVQSAAYSPLPSPLEFRTQ